MSNIEEIWKDVVGYEGIYKISNFGRVKILSRKVNVCGGGVAIKKEKFKKIRTSYQGYLTTNLNLNGCVKLGRIHIMVAKAFIPNPENKPFVCHKDNNKSNPNVSNLYWGTRKENTDQAVKDGLYASGENHKRSKFKNYEVSIIREAIEFGYSQAKISRYFRVSGSTISKIKLKKRWVSTVY